MKNLKTINALFEQAENETKFKLLAQPTTKPAGSGSVRIQWQYRFSWPAKNPLLGDVKELINTINNSTDGDAKQVLSAIQGSDGTHEVGILRAEASTQNNRLFGKDLGEFTGWIYLFYPDTINKEAVPDNQKVMPGIAGRMTYLLDAKGEFKKYFQAPGKGQSAQTGDKKVDQSTPSPTVFKLASITLADGSANSWFNSTEGLRIQYLNPVYSKIGDTKVPITTTGDIVEIFWGFMSNLPEGLAIAKPADAKELTTYTPNLKSAILKLFEAAAKYDQSNFGSVDADVLTQDLYADMFYAVVILGLNAGKIDTTSLDFTKNLTSAPYYAPFKAALNDSGKIVKTVSGTSGTASSTFDGTVVSNETDLAKIISGGLIGYGTPAADVDTVDKVKAKWNSYVPNTYSKKFEEIVAKLPFNSTTNTSLAEFKNIQFFAINQNGTYGPKTKAGFKSAFEKSSIK